MDKYEDVLEHYGILGMRWGVRRTPEQLARARAKRKEKGKPVTPTKKSKREPSEDAKRAAEAKKKAKKGGAQTLTNKELKDLNERLNLEQNYTRLTSTPQGQGKIKKGHKFVKDAVDMGKTANEIYNLANSPAAKEIKKAIR